MSTKLKLGVSACLLGMKVRYDGGQKRHRAVSILRRRFKLVPVCPEVEAGLSIPRGPMQLVGRNDRPRLVVISSGIDLTGVLNDWAKKKVKKLKKEKLSGLVLKRRSPSCAIDDAELFTLAGRKKGTTAGLFSAAVMERYPDLPILHEEDLADPGLRRDFIGRVVEFSSGSALE